MLVVGFYVVCVYPPVTHSEMGSNASYQLPAQCSLIDMLIIIMRFDTWSVSVDLRSTWQYLSLPFAIVPALRAPWFTRSYFAPSRCHRSGEEDLI